MNSKGFCYLTKPKREAVVAVTYLGRGTPCLHWRCPQACMEPKA